MMAVSAIGMEVRAGTLGQRFINIVNSGQAGPLGRRKIGHNAELLKLSGGFFTELLRREADDRAEALAVAELTLCAAGKVPAQISAATWNEQVRNQ